MASALRELVQRRQNRGVYAMLAQDPASAFRKKLRRDFAHVGVPEACVQAAVLTINRGNDAGSQRQPASNVADLVSRNVKFVMIATALYTHVEAISTATHGRSAAAELVDELRALKDDELTSSVGAAGDDSSALARPAAGRSLQKALGSLQQRLQVNLTTKLSTKC